MPIVTDTSAIESSRGITGRLPAGLLQPDFQAGTDDIVEIGLLNNMPDQALRATERQFTELVGAAAGNRRVRLRLFFLEDLARSDVARAYLLSRYANTHTLLRTRLDALIVTGQEPRAPNLADEPYWSNLTQVIDWAQQHTISSIWSCLAAHAAVLHLDGIERRRMGSKLCGVFECDPVENNGLLHGITEPVSIPHSRYNDLPEGELSRKGYRVLMRSPRAGADLFVKQDRGLSVFLQGHPEYDAHTLLGEYRRDIGRFLRGEMACCPMLPQDYFDAPSTRILMDFEERARADRRPELLAKFPEKRIIGGLVNRWRPSAVTLFRNWVEYILSQKAARTQDAS